MAGSSSFGVYRPMISCSIGRYDSGQFVVDIHVELSRSTSSRSLPSRSTVLRSVKFGLLNAQSVENKATNIAAVIDEGCYDVFLFTETWHTASKDVPIWRCIPSGYICFDAPRPTTGSSAKTNHGGVATIISDQLKCKLVSLPFRPKTFQSVCFLVTDFTSTVMVLFIYLTWVCGSKWSLL